MKKPFFIFYNAIRVFLISVSAAISSITNATSRKNNDDRDSKKEPNDRMMFRKLFIKKLLVCSKKMKRLPKRLR